MAVLGALAAVAGRAGEISAEELRLFRAGPAEAVTASLRADSTPKTWRTAVAGNRGYAAWTESVFSDSEQADPAFSAPDAIVASDGVDNLAKYALGLDPHITARPEDLPETGQLDEHFLLWYRRPSDTDDVEYRVEASTDGVNWTSDGVTQEPILGNEDAESWQAHYQAAPGRMVWLRLVLALRK